MKDPLDSRVARYLAFDRVNRPYLEWQVEQFLPFIGERVLEVGCGVGSIIGLLGSRAMVHGVEIEPDVLEIAAARFPDRQRYRFSSGDFMRLTETQVTQLRDERFDSIVCLNVLEHIENDIGALQRMAGLLPSGGVVALLVPAHPCLYGTYDKLDGHFRRYSRRSLLDAISHTGLRVERLRYFNCVGAIGWWIQYKLLRKSIHGEGEFGLMNRLVPLLRRVERALPPPFGLSIIAILRKA